MHTTKFLIAHYTTIAICILGLIGNLLCALVLFNRRTTASPYIYILQGLTLSDTALLTLSLIRAGSNLGGVWLQEEILYYVYIDFFWDWIATSCTKYYTVAISLERFFFVKYPLQASRFMTLTTSKRVAASVFLFCVCLSCFSYIYTNYVDANSFHLYVAVVLHFTPFILVLIFNILVFWVLKRYSKERKLMRTTSGSEDDSSVTRMLMGVTVIFGVCYSFEMVRRIMNFAWSEYMNTYEYYDYWINVLADIFYVLNSSVNFIIYCLLGKSFRRVFISVCKAFVGKEDKNGRKMASKNSTSSSYSKDTSVASMESELDKVG